MYARSAFLKRTFFVVGLSLLCKGTTLEAAIITPIDAVASGALANRGPTLTITGDGLDPIPPNVLDKNHNEAPETTEGGGMWLAPKTTDPLVSITFELNAPHAINKLHIWNYAEVAFENAGSFTARGANEVRVYADGNVVPIQTVFFDQTTPPPSANFAGGANWGIDYNTVVKSYDITPFTATFVKFEIVSNHGDGGHVGLSEVRFEFVPEPSSLLMLIVGGIGLLRCRRRRLL